MITKQSSAERLKAITAVIVKQLPTDFKPRLAVVTGSGLGYIADVMDQEVCRIPYSSLPDFVQTTVQGHTGELVCGYIGATPVLFFKGRKHFYEFATEYSDTQALAEVALPVQLARSLGADIYFATNAVGGLDVELAVGSVCLIKTHIGLFFPNVLRAIATTSAERFVPTNELYDPMLRGSFLAAASSTGHDAAVIEGTYAAVTGPSYESVGEVLALRSMGAMTVGMSVVPEVLAARSLGMRCVAASMVTNVVDAMGANATSHQEVTSICASPEVQQRFLDITQTFIRTVPLD